MDASRPKEPPERPEDLLEAIEPARWDSFELRRPDFERWVGAFPVEVWRDCLRPRLNPLRIDRAEALLRVVEALGDFELFSDLVETLVAQKNLPTDWVGHALDVMEAAIGRAETDRSASLAIEEESSTRVGVAKESIVEESIETLEADADGPRVVADVLRTVESSFRDELLEDLALRSPDGLGRRAPLERFSPGTLGRDAKASDELATERRRTVGESSPARRGPLGSLVTSIDGDGRGLIALATFDERGPFASAFLCDLIDGVIGATTALGDDPRSFLAELAGRPERESLLDRVKPTLELLSGCLSLSEPSALVREALDRLVGDDFRPRPFLAPEFADRDEAPKLDRPKVQEILDLCPDWSDDSPLVARLAREIYLREDSTVPDPDRDAGAYRFYFEHRLAGRLERFARMFVWTAAFRRAGGLDDEPTRAILTLARRLIDPQHAVPGHPFAIEWTTRILTRALESERIRRAGS